MTAHAFEEAQKELLRSLAHHMILVAERAQILDDSRANHNILENAYLIWTGKAVFMWAAVSPDGSEELEESFDPVTCNPRVYHAQELGSAGWIGERTPLLSNLLPAFTFKSSADIVSPDNYVDGPISQINNSSTDPFHSRCLSCNSAFDVYVGGLCGLCLPLSLDFPIDRIPDPLDEPQQDQYISEPRASANAHSTSRLENQLDWSDFLNLSVLKMSGVPVGLDDHPTTYSNLPGIPNASHTSCLSTPEIESGPTPLTYDLLESASPTIAVERPSFGVEPLAGDSVHGKSMYGLEFTFQHVESSKPTQSQSSLMVREKKRQRNSEKTKAEMYKACRLACHERPRNLEKIEAEMYKACQLTCHEPPRNSFTSMCNYISPMIQSLALPWNTAYFQNKPKCQGSSEPNSKFPDSREPRYGANVTNEFSGRFLV